MIVFRDIRSIPNYFLKPITILTRVVRCERVSGVTLRRPPLFSVFFVRRTADSEERTVTAQTRLLQRKVQPRRWQNRRVQRLR